MLWESKGWEFRRRKAVEEKGGEAQSLRETAGGGKALEVDAAPPPAPSGKKKKKKHKFAADQAGSHPDGAQPADPAVGDNGVASPHEKKVASDVPPTGPSKSPGAPIGPRLPGGGACIHIDHSEDAL